MTSLTALFPKSLGGSSALCFKPRGIVAFECKPIASDLYASSRQRQTSAFAASAAAVTRGFAILRQIDRIKGRSPFILDQFSGDDCFTQGSEGQLL